MKKRIPDTIEEFLRLRNKHVILSIKLFRDVCRRTQRLEKLVSKVQKNIRR